MRCTVSTLVVIFKTSAAFLYHCRLGACSDRKGKMMSTPLKCHVRIRWSYFSYYILPFWKASKLESFFLHGFISVRTVLRQFTLKEMTSSPTSRASEKQGRPMCRFVLPQWALVSLEAPPGACSVHQHQQGVISL